MPKEFVFRGKKSRISAYHSTGCPKFYVAFGTFAGIDPTTSAGVDTQRWFGALKRTFGSARGFDIRTDLQQVPHPDQTDHEDQPTNVLGRIEPEPDPSD